MGANQSKFDYASSLKSTATSTTAVPSANSRRTSTTSTTRRGRAPSTGATALPQSSTSNERRRGAVAAISTRADEDLLEQTLSRCTTRNQRHARYNSSSNCTDPSSTMAVADSGYVSSGLIFPLTSTITDLGGRASLPDDAAPAQTNSPASVIAFTSLWLTNTATCHRLPPPPSYHHRPLATHAISVDAVLRELRCAPQKTHAILDRVFETARQLQDSRDHAAAYRVALTWAQEAQSALNDNDDSTDNPSQIAAVWVARCRLHGWGVRGQVRDGFELLRDLADHGVWQAFLPLAACYFEGVTAHDGQTIQPVDHALALSWFSTAAQLDPSKYCTHGENNAKQVVAMAQLRVGAMSLKDQDDQRLAFSWFLKSANNDNPYAQFLVAVYYALGHIVPQDMNRVKEYLRKSAEQDFGSAQADLGILLFTEKAYEEAMQWLERAEQAQDIRALYHLGYMYESREGVPAPVSTTISNERAIYCFKAAAERSNVLAQHRLGMHYCDGSLGLQRDPVKAMHFFRQAADLGYPPAQRRLGLMYLEGLNIPSAIYHAQIQQQKDDGIARAWIEKAALEGRDGQAYVVLGECYQKGRGVKGGPDISKALECYWQAAQIKGPHQINGFYAHAALLISQGRYQEAYTSYVHASELAIQQRSTLAANNPNLAAHRLTGIGRLAQLMVARYSLQGWADVPVDEPRAFRILRQLANHDMEIGDVVDYWLAWCYDNHKGVDGDCVDHKAMAFNYYLKAAKGDDVDAQAQVGKMLTRGIGTAENLDEAVSWYRKAAGKRHPAATYTLGILSLHHLRDIGGAIKHFERAIELGRTEAIDRLVELYQNLRSRPITPSADKPSENGSSSSQSDMKRCADRADIILAIITRAAEKGNNPVAQRELGRLYSSAMGSPEDHKKAFDLFSKAASQHDGIATVMLGNFYEHGKSVTQDSRRALALYQQAIKLGTETAFFAAAKLLHQREQFEEAYKFYTLAAEHPKLQHIPTGKQARLMVARYILYNHITVTTNTKEEAFGALCALAVEENFSPAYFWLGDCYHYGRGTAVDLSLAVRWYTDAAEEADNVDAMIRLANVYDNGVEGVVAPDKHLALQYCSNAARHGNAEAQYYLGMAYWRGRYDLPIDEVKATDLFTESAQKDYGPSHWALGKMSYEQGFEDLALRSWDNGVKIKDNLSMRSQAQLLMTLLPNVPNEEDRQKQYILAIRLFNCAAEQGDAESDLYLGRIFSTEAKGHQHKHQLLMEHMLDKDDDNNKVQDDLQIMHYNLQKDKEEAAKFHLGRAAAAGLVEAMYHAGEIWYEQGDFETAYPFYKKAAERGHTLARVMWARYKLSIPLPSVEADCEGGFRELLCCAEQDRCSLAYYTLGQCYERGLGTPASDDQALEWYHRSYEDTTDPEAAFRIGSIEAKLGRHDHAATWYQLACRFSAHARAHYELGRYYLHSVASPHLEDAVQHLEYAARENDSDAMYELGSLLLLSNDGMFGVEQQQQGLLWLEQAADRCRHLPSLVLLGELYRTGKDYYPMTTDAMGLDTDHMVTVVPVQLDRAFDLFCQAAELGDKTAMLHVGTFYEHGLNMPVNIAKAKVWYELAQGAESSWAAKLSLARLLHNHYEDERLRAYRLFESSFACAKTDEERRESKIYQSRYRLFGYHGETNTRQQKAAMDTLLRYACDGEASVYYDVARAYEEGLGVPRPDPNGARAWYVRLEQLTTNLAPEQENLLDKDFRQNITDALQRLASIYRMKLAGTPADHARAEALEEHAARRRAAL